MNPRLITASNLVAALDLEPHVEGGFFRRTYQADHRDMLETEGGQRFLMTSIYYLLTAESPVGQFHFNQSDILHYFHLASRLLNGENGFGLISEAVSSGFDFADMEIGNRRKLTTQYPQHRALIEMLTRDED